MLVAIAGPWVCVGGAIYKEEPIAEALTDYVRAGRSSKHLERVFHCLKKAVTSLWEYYTTLSSSLEEGPCGFPYICEYEGRSFSYVKQLMADYGKLVYKVQEGEDFRIVKFATEYNDAAHRLLADTINGESFAPVLHHVSSCKYGGRWMIVMGYVEGQMALGEELSDEHHNQLKRAIGRLHKAGIVFGDLRV